LTVAIKLNDQFSKGIKDVGTNAKSALGSGDDGLGGLAASAGKAFLAAGALIGTSIVAGLAAAVTKAADFEAGMSRVSALSGASAEDMVKLNEAALELAGQTVFKGTEVAAGMEALAMAGLNVNQVLDTMPGLLSTATAGNTDLQATADIVTNVMSGFGLDSTETQRIADVLAATFTSSNTTMDSLGETLKYVAPLANAAGLSLESMAAASGILGNVGISGSQAGTSLRGMIDGLIAPTSKAQEHLDALDITLTDLDGNLLPLPELVGSLQEGLEGLNPSESVRVLKDLVGVEAMGGLQALLAAGPEEIQAYSSELENSLGRSAEVAKESANNLKGAWTGLTSAFDSILIKIGMEVTPIFKQLLTDTITPLVRAIGEFATSMGGFDVIFKDALTFVVGFKNTALNILSELFNNASFAAEFLGNLGSVFLAAQRMNYTFAFGTSGNGGMVGIIIELAKVVWAPLEAGFLIIWDAIKIPLVKGINFMQEMFTAGINGIIRSFNSLAEVIGVSIDEIDFTPLTVDAPKTAAERWAESGADISTALDTVGDHMTDMKDGIVTDLDNVSSAVGDTWKTAAHLADEGLAEVVEKYDGATTKIKQEAPKDGKEIGESLAQPIVKAMDDAGEEVAAGFLSKMHSAMIDPESGMGKVLTNSLAGAINGNSFQDTVAGLGQTFGTMIGGPIGGAILGQVMGKLAEAKPKAAERAEGAFGGLLRGFEGAGGDVSKMGGLEGELGGIFSKKDGSIKEDTAAGVLMGQLIKFGVSKDAAETLLKNILPKIRQGKKLGASQVREVNEALTEALVGAEMRDIEARGRVSSFEDLLTESAESRLGITPAANGYNGMVSEPTLFLAGEAGPEMVDITPSSRMSGGFSGSGGSSFHFNFSVNTIDEQGVRSFIEQDAKPFIVQMLNRESTRGSTVMYSTGLTTDPSV
tara:strand:- start:22 stop:2808 length:2787 start_codon:yes stop_codon:yes gene_type:complete